MGSKAAGKIKKNQRQQDGDPAFADVVHDVGLVMIEPELFAVFPSAEAVNAALRLLVKASRKAISSKAAKDARAKLKAQSHGDQA
jgi:hypothetical protein